MSNEQNIIIPQSKFNYTLTVQYKEGYFQDSKTSLIQEVQYNMPFKMTVEQMQSDYPNCKITNVVLN